MKLIQRNDAQKDPATEVISHDVAPLTVNTDARSYARVGWMIVLFGVLGFLLWASFAPLDKGVPMSGTVAKETNRKSVQHPTGGVISVVRSPGGPVVSAASTTPRSTSRRADANAFVLELHAVETV